ncbi:polyprenyl glycosylphosphotransferase [Leifsonia sp. Leaf264]|nr:polyprenyl glycosylphosphotransferase [Leifsonia sp. Leaf264]
MKLLTQAIEENMATSSRVTKQADWNQKYGQLLFFSDLVVIALSVAVAQYVGGLPSTIAGIGELLTFTTPMIISISVVLVWMFALTAAGSRSTRHIGAGSIEYRRVINSTLIVFGAGGMAAYFLDIGGLQRYFAFAFLLGLPAVILERYFWRNWLAARRREGRMSHRVLLVGSVASVTAMARDLARAPESGLKVVGACTPSGAVAGVIDGTEIPVSGSLTNLIESLDAVNADTVVITSANEMSPSLVRELSWQLEPGRQHLVVAPSLTDIGGPRLHTRPVAGLPLIHVETPRYYGGKLYIKRFFDIVASGTLIVLLAPFLAAVTIAVRLSTPGSVIFRQERIGLRGERFDMLKFRSMYMDAEDRLAELENVARAEGNSVMFKMKNDPRVTPIGGFLRRFSLDELPQLFNVFRGTMSIVGPRPPLEREVEQYDQHVHRRFLVKPGITGLWQVSGRSNLNWEETVRLDLYYVENWNLTGDLLILWKTARAVLGSDGAY